MLSLLPALTVPIVLFLSLLIVRIATVALSLTGLSKDLAQFPALSAFTGSGFTTKESEEIVNHPTRRRIVMFLMLSGNAGIVLAISSVIMFLMYTREQDDWYDAVWFRVAILLMGVLALLILANSRLVERVLWQVNTWTLRRWANLDVCDYTSLLRLSHDYAVYEVNVHEDDWLAGKTLAKSQLASEGILVLGMERRDGKYHGAPQGQSLIKAGDTLVLYGPQDTMLDLVQRQADMVGNLQHVIAVTKQLDIIEAEQEGEEGAAQNKTNTLLNRQPTHLALV